MCRGGKGGQILEPGKLTDMQRGLLGAGRSQKRGWGRGAIARSNCGRFKWLLGNASHQEHSEQDQHTGAWQFSWQFAQGGQAGEMSRKSLATSSRAYNPLARSWEHQKSWYPPGKELCLCGPFSCKNWCSDWNRVCKATSTCPGPGLQGVPEFPYQNHSC